MYVNWSQSKEVHRTAGLGHLLPTNLQRKQTLERQESDRHRTVAPLIKCRFALPSPGRHQFRRPDSEQYCPDWNDRAAAARPSGSGFVDRSRLPSYAALNASRKRTGPGRSTTPRTPRCEHISGWTDVASFEHGSETDTHSQEGQRTQSSRLSIYWSVV
jgi:hypothetical protein